MEYSGHHVDYFHCLDCRHIWNIPKGGDGPVNHVTPLPEPRSLKADKQQESTNELFARAERALKTFRSLGAQYQALEIDAIRVRRKALDVMKAYRRLLGSERVWERARLTRIIRRLTTTDLRTWRQRKSGAA